MPRHLALALHNHQPVGNFGVVFEQAYRLAYEPMVSALLRHPGVRLALHYSGPLLDWLRLRHPELLGRVRALVERGQVEVMTGGYYEPILVAIPDDDKLGQIRKMTAAVEREFGCSPTGLWLAERVWEPHLPRPLAEAGVQYTIVDDTHFKYVGLTADEDLLGYYVTEEQGRGVKVFATSKYLRYAVPWVGVGEVMEWLAGLPEGSLAVMGDDGEKFGMWPGSDKLCWADGWVDEFFAALEDSPGIVTITPGEWTSRCDPLGRVYLTAASYDEMGEWALPAEASRRLAALKHKLERSDAEGALAFVRGGFWRSFLVKYPELNTLHKKALWVHDRVAAVADIGAREQAQDELWQGECNCPYWHGVFGGGYLPHIRGANYEHLLRAEDIADRSIRGADAWIEATIADFDRDGHDEILVSGNAANLYLAPALGGAVFEWDWREKGLNMVNVMTRRPEAYHEEMLAAIESGNFSVFGEPESEEDLAVETIHTTRVRVKERGIERHLHYDRYRRVSLIDHFLGPETTLEAFAACEHTERGDFVEQPYGARVEQGDGCVRVELSREGQLSLGEKSLALRLVKTLAARGASGLVVDYRLENLSGQPIETTFGCETNWALMSGHSQHAYYLIDGQGREWLDTQDEREDVSSVRMVVAWAKVAAEMRVSRPCTLWRFPIETISNSEAGFERVYQGSCLLPHWQLRLAPGERWEVRLDFSLQGG